jgi:hypothetical protein
MMEWVVVRVYKPSLGCSLLSSLHLSDSFYSLKTNTVLLYVGLVFLFFKKFLRTTNVRVGQMSSFPFPKWLGWLRMESFCQRGPNKIRYHIYMAATFPV